ncbi:hypothetical protein B7759_05963 (plasmid) [Burkholderia glumae]|nr:hypothetical protein B7759_05963 [Burkholderia glumae]
MLRRKAAIAELAPTRYAGRPLTEDRFLPLLWPSVRRLANRPAAPDDESRKKRGVGRAARNARNTAPRALTRRAAKLQSRESDGERRARRCGCKVEAGYVHAGAGCSHGEARPVASNQTFQTRARKTGRAGERARCGGRHAHVNGSGCTLGAAASREAIASPGWPCAAGEEKAAAAGADRPSRPRRRAAGVE